MMKNGNSLLPNYQKDSDLVNNTIKDYYILDFITSKEEYKEKVVIALINKIERSDKNGYVPKKKRKKKSKE